ncbi:hypothetical protein TSMEX_000869 [Taenia solium]|eukprot:TsM_000752400 transcript=TsM_000752400 gene=TsM_000752400
MYRHEIKEKLAASLSVVMKCLASSELFNKMIHKEKVVRWFGNLLLVTDKYGMIVGSVVMGGLGDAFYNSAPFSELCETRSVANLI